MIFREVYLEEGQVFADKHNAIFFEVSAKTKHNLDALFNRINGSASEDQ